MSDPETLILKVGVVVITTLALLRVIWHDLNNLIKDVRRDRKKRPGA
jgi:hypothetical protein